MARFCSQCGKPLEEGQVCDCQEQNRRNAIEPVQKEVDQSAAAPQAAAGTVPPQQGAVPVPPDFGAYQGGMQQQPQNPQGYQQVPLGAQPYYQQQVAAPSAWNLYFKRLGSLIKCIFKAPATAVSTLVKQKDYPVAWGIAGVNSVVFALMVIAFCNRICDGVGNFGALFGMSGLFGFEFPYGRIFFTSLIGSFAAVMLFICITMFFVKVVYRREMGFTAGLCVAAGFSIPVVLFNFAAMVFVFLWPPMAMFLYSCGVIFSYFFGYQGIKAASGLEDNKLLYCSALTFVTANLANLLILYVLTKNLIL